MAVKDAKYLSNNRIKNASGHRIKAVSDMISALDFFRADFKKVPVKLLRELENKMCYFVGQIQTTINVRHTRSRKSVTSKALKI